MSDHVSLFMNQTFSLEEEAICPWEILDSINCPPDDGWVKPDFGYVPIGFSMVSSTMSAVGALLTIIPYVIWKDLRTVIRRIITFLAIADLLTALSYLMGTINYITHNYKQSQSGSAVDLVACKQFYTICQIQSFLSCWFSVSSFLWTGILTLYLYCKISNGNNISRLNQCYPLAHIVSWGLPMALTFPLLVIGYLGYSMFAAGGWCFVNADHSIHSGINSNYKLSLKAIVTILVGGKAIEIFTYIWVMVLFCKIYHKIHKGNSEPLSTQDKDNNLSSINLLRQVEKKLYAIPIAFVMLRIWGTVQFFISIGVFNVHKISHSGCLPKWLFTVYYAFAIIQSVGDGGQGWCNFLLYVIWSEKIRSRLFFIPFRACCLEVTKYFASSSPPTQNYGIINEEEGESSNSSVKFQRRLLLKNMSDSNEHSRLLESS